MEIIMSDYKEMSSWVDFGLWNKICSVVYNTKSLNSPSNRFLKEQYILAGLQQSNVRNNISWLDYQDYDISFNDWQAGKIEVKTGNGMLFTPKGKAKKVVKIKVKNNLGGVQGRTTLDKVFDHMMVVQLYPIFCVAFVPYSTVEKYLTILSDGFGADIPFEEFEIVYQQKTFATDAMLPDPKQIVLAQLKSMEL